MASKITPSRIDRAARPLAMAEISHRGRRRHARRRGGGEGTPVVLLHGLTATRRYVVMGSRALERDGHRVVAYDARGHGASSTGAEPGRLRLRDARRRPARRARRPRDRPRACWPAPRWARTRSCASRSTTPTASPASWSITPAFDPDDADEERGSTAGTRSRRACARAAWRASSRPTATPRSPEQLARHDRPRAAPAARRARAPRGARRRAARRAALAPVRGLGRAGRARRCPRWSSPAATRPTPSTRTRSASATRRRSRAPACVSEEPGSSPLAWQGGAGLEGDRRARAVAASRLRHDPRHEQQRALDHHLAVVGRREQPLVRRPRRATKHAPKPGPSATSVQLPRSGSSAAAGRRGAVAEAVAPPPSTPTKPTRSRSRT